MVKKINKTIVFNLMIQLFIVKLIIKIIILMTMKQRKYKNYKLMIKIKRNK